MEEEASGEIMRKGDCENRLIVGLLALYAIYFYFYPILPPKWLIFGLNLHAIYLYFYLILPPKSSGQHAWLSHINFVR